MRKDPEETYSLKEKLAVTAMIGEKRHLREVEAMKSSRCGTMNMPSGRWIRF